MSPATGGPSARDTAGLFVTFEGGESAGKSTQVAALSERARAEGHDVTACREPGGTALGERLRDALFASEAAPSELAELLVFAAARAQLVHTVIRPALERGALVLCDRFADSTIAYQHYGHGVDRAIVDAVNDFATGGLEPHLTVLLDIEPQAGRGRGAGERDYLEREGAEFHEQVRRGYLALAGGAPERWLVLDAARPVEELSSRIWQRISALIQEAG